MDPHAGGAHSLGAWDDWWRVILAGIVNDVSFLINFEKSTWAESRWVVDTGDLGPQIVLLLSEEEWVGNNVTLEIPCEEDFDGSGSDEILWFQIW